VQFFSEWNDAPDGKGQWYRAYGLEVRFSFSLSLYSLSPPLLHPFPLSSVPLSSVLSSLFSRLFLFLHFLDPPISVVG
jgi:hypothetical protein